MKALRLFFAMTAAFFLVSASEAPARDLTVKLPLSKILTPNGSPTIPPEWQGIWVTTDVIKDCETLAIIIPSSTENDTLCTGDMPDPTDDPENPTEFVCDGTVTGTSFDITCTGNVAIDDSCTANFTVRQVATRTGDSYSAVLTISIAYSGTCPEEYVDSCLRVETTANRIGSGNVECATPVEATTWGYIKSRHR